MQSTSGNQAGSESMFPGPGQSRQSLSRADTQDVEGDGAEANVVPMVLELEEESKDQPAGNDVHAVLAAHGLSGVYDPSPHPQSHIPRPLSKAAAVVDLASLSQEQLMHFLLNPVPKEMVSWSAGLFGTAEGLLSFIRNIPSRRKPVFIC
jgi:hypothetical protein